MPLFSFILKSENFEEGDSICYDCYVNTPEFYALGKDCSEVRLSNLVIFWVLSKDTVGIGD